MIGSRTPPLLRRPHGPRPTAVVPLCRQASRLLTPCSRAPARPPRAHTLGPCSGTAQQWARAVHSPEAPGRHPRKPMQRQTASQHVSAGRRGCAHARLRARHAASIDATKPPTPPPARGSNPPLRAPGGASRPQAGNMALHQCWVCMGARCPGPLVGKCCCIVSGPVLEPLVMVCARVTQGTGVQCRTACVQTVVMLAMGGGGCSEHAHAHGLPSPAGSLCAWVRAYVGAAHVLTPPNTSPAPGCHSPRHCRPTQYMLLLRAAPYSVLRRAAPTTTV